MVLRGLGAGSSTSDLPYIRPGVTALWSPALALAHRHLQTLKLHLLWGLFRQMFGLSSCPVGFYNLCMLKMVGGLSEASICLH